MSKSLDSTKHISEVIQSQKVSFLQIFCHLFILLVILLINLSINKQNKYYFQYQKQTDMSKFTNFTNGVISGLSNFIWFQKSNQPTEQRACQPANQISKLGSLGQQINILHESQKQIEDQSTTPTAFEQSQCRLDKKFAQIIQQIRLGLKIDKSPGVKYICFAGPTSAGKSTMINQLFGLQQNVGLGSTTSEIKEVMKDDKIAVYDMPGVSNQWLSFSEDNIRLLHDMDHVFVLYDKCPEENRRLIVLLQALKRPFTLVRTKCDTRQENDLHTVEEWLQLDQKKFATFFKGKYPVRATGRGQRSQVKNIIESLKSNQSVMEPEVKPQVLTKSKNMSG